MLIDLHAKSDVGRVRRGNEDNFLLLNLTAPKTWSGSDGPENPAEMNQFPLGERGLVLVVSDGMGGALAGDVASRMAIEAVRDSCKKHGVVPGIQTRNPALARFWKDRGMRFLGCSSETGMLFEKASEIVQALS